MDCGTSLTNYLKFKRLSIHERNEPHFGGVKGSIFNSIFASMSENYGN